MSATTTQTTERRAALSLAGIFALRMLGLFMIYPVFAIYARRLPDATPFRVGLALGIYGLAQAICQMPLGLLSDKVGRKRVIAAGLLLFAAGSIVAACAHSVTIIILGRWLQGMGAVGSAVLALVADLTAESSRSRAMAVIGMSIGAAFGIAVVLGPVLNAEIGVPGMFWLTAVFAVFCLLLLFTAVPAPAHPIHQAETEPTPGMLLRVLRDGRLLRLDFGILAQHAILTATFLGLPFLLQHAGMSLDRQWEIYLLAFLLSGAAMFPVLARAERRGRTRTLILGSVVTIALVQGGFLIGGGLSVLIVLVSLFLIAFNFLEAVLPAQISKLAPVSVRGTAIGIYSSSQFLGLFLGGILGGWCQDRFGPIGAFAFSLVVAVAWVAVSLLFDDS